MDQTQIDLINTITTNTLYIDKVQKFANLLDKTEILIEQKLGNNLKEINKLKITFDNNLELFRIIKNNLHTN